MMSEPRTRRVTLLLPATVVLLSYFLGAFGSFSNVTLSLTPPRGWNSYDSFSWIVSEDEFLQNADYVAKNLLKHGYEYVVVDFLWYRKHEPGASVTSPGYDIVDEWGRPEPDPVRWPSTAGRKGFKPIADKVHAMGLKFGIHVMRGISSAAVEKNTPILCSKDCPVGFEEANWRAGDITVPGGECSWMWNCFISVNTSSVGGRAFIYSLYEQYAEWEVDFVKHDCVFGLWDMNVPEITTVGEAMERAGRPMVYSLSPGVSATPEMGKQVAHLSHTYRITSDDWDTWWDVQSHFSVARDFAAAGLIGAPGLRGGQSWPDMDMLPIGWLTDPGAPYGPYRSTSLTRDEQMTQITLWAIAKSPLMFGGDLRNIDQWTLDLITHKNVLDMNAHSTHNRELSSSVQSLLPNFILEDCAMAKFGQWRLQRTENCDDHLCWSSILKPGYSKGRREAPLADCLSWRGSPWPTSDSVSNSSSIYHGIMRGQLLSSTTSAVCLESDRLLSTTTDGNALFSDCDDTASKIRYATSVTQVWQLTPDGRLMSHDGLCALPQQSSNDWRVWVARGAEGQSYVAFFNLGSERTEISVALDDVLNHVSPVDLSISDLSQRPDDGGEKILSGTLSWARRFSSVHKALLQSARWSCEGKDVWSNTHFIANVTELTASVESHGTVLYELRCIPSKIGQFSLGFFWYLIAFVTVMAFAFTRLQSNYDRRLKGDANISQDKLIDPETEVQR